MNWRLWPVVAALPLAGCSHLDSIDDNLGRQERLDRLESIDHWSLVGRLVVDTGEQRDRVRVVWEQQGDRLILTISGIVLGAGSVRIEGDSEQLTITARGETRILDNPEEELARELGFGWWLPVASVRHWVLGRPDDAFPVSAEQWTEGVPDKLVQRDWETVYEEYQLIDGVLLPRSMSMRQGNLQLSLQITRFTTTDNQA